jgi:hypothetical protein
MLPARFARGISRLAAANPTIAITRQASQQPGPVIRHLLVAQRAIDVGSASVRLLFDRYHRRVSANAGRTSSKLVSIVDIAPWSKTSGLPAPWTSW